MAHVTTPSAAAVLDAYDFSAIRRVADIGGGTGTLLASILRAYPAMTGLLCDTPTTIDLARPALAAAGVFARCDLVEGEFLAEPVPSAADRYSFSRVLHDWDDRPATPAGEAPRHLTSVFFNTLRRYGNRGYRIDIPVSWRFSWAVAARRD